MLSLFFANASLGVLALVWHWDRNDNRRRRADMFDLCVSLFDNPQFEQRCGDFPSLTGHFQSTKFTLTAIPDTIGYRKIPSLWMQVTLFSALAVDGTIDVLARPQNIEFFSPSYDLDIELPIPSGWPQPIQFRSNTANHGLDVNLVECSIGKMFGDNRIKELLITARGLRVVYQLRQAEKSRYLVFRMAEFEEITVSPDFLRPLMEDMLKLRDNIRAPLTIAYA